MSSAKGKQFVMKQEFNNVKLEPNKDFIGEMETHYNIPWRICICDAYDWEPRHDVYFQCLKDCEAGEWSIETEVLLKLGTKTVKFTNQIFSNKSIDCVMYGAENQDLNDFVIDGKLKVECHVTILKMTGIRKEKLRNFDESAAKFWDVVLKVEDQKFHVNKMYLATHSSYFESLFLENFQESGKSEIELMDIDPKDFQNFLEFIYAESSLEGVLQLADFFDAKTVIRRCEEFLLEKSKEPLKVKFEMAIKYKFDKLKKKCISEMKTADDVVSVIPEDAFSFDQNIWKELLLKCHSTKIYTGFRF